MSNTRRKEYNLTDKDDVIAAFETDFADPGALKSGEYLEGHVLERAKAMFSGSRCTVIEVLREWLLLREDPRTMIAVTVIRELGIRELREEVVDLRKDVQAGRVFRRWYVQNIDKTISILDEAANEKRES